LGAQQPSRDAAARPSPGTAAISGTVVADEPDGRPLRRVMVTLSAASSGSLQRATTTDEAGRFAFTRLPAGNYSALRASKAGWVPVTFGEKRTAGIGTPITLGEDQKLTVVLKMLRGGVIAGTLFDQTGNPSPQVSIEATPIRVVNGVRTAAPRVGFMSATTDDRGAYRIYGLAPGDYVIAASPRSLGSGDVRPITEDEMRWAQQQLRPAAALAAAPAPAPRPAQAIAYTPVYYPGTIDMNSAVLVTLAAGQERSGLDFGLQLITTARIEGTVVDPDGQTPQNVTLNIVPKTDSSLGLGSMFLIETMLMLSRPAAVDGKFAIPGVRPGEYTLTARAAARGATPAPAAAAPSGRGGAGAAAMTLWAMTDITVDGNDQSGIVLRLQPGMSVSGHVVFESAALTPPSDLSSVTVRLAAAPSPTGVTVTVGGSGGQVGADGTFSLEGVAPGRYTIAGSVPAPTPAATWLLKSALVDGQDVSDLPFEIKPDQDVAKVVVTFTDKSSEVSGRLLDGAGRPTPEFSIILFPADRRFWVPRGRRVRPPVRASTDGTFKFANLFPGEYYVAALTDFEPNDYYNPVFLDQVIAAGALKITVAEGEKKIQDLKIAGG
jgi:hypothetical protein